MSIHIFKRLSFKKVSIESRVNTSSWRLGLRLYARVYCVQAKYDEERADHSIKQQQTSRQPDRQQADQQWNRLGDK